MEDRCVCCDRIIPEDSQYCPICRYEAEQKKQRQIDRIRSMSVEELARFINHIENAPCSCCNHKDCDGDSTNHTKCHNGIKQWLETEVEE